MDTRTTEAVQCIYDDVLMYVRFSVFKGEPVIAGQSPSDVLNDAYIYLVNWISSADLEGKDVIDLKKIFASFLIRNCRNLLKTRLRDYRVEFDIDSEPLESPRPIRVESYGLESVEISFVRMKLRGYNRAKVCDGLGISRRQYDLIQQSVVSKIQSS